MHFRTMLSHPTARTNAPPASNAVAVTASAVIQPGVSH